MDIKGIGRRSVFVLLVAGISALASAAAVPSTGETAPAGERIFRDKNCQYCHSVEVVGLARSHESEKMRGPDLSSSGEELSVEEMLLFLKRRKVSSEASEGRPVVRETHWKTFWGTEEEAQVLAEWLVSLTEGATTASH